MSLVFLDTETLGFSLDQDIWEIAYAIDDGPILSCIVEHDLHNANPEALELNGYKNRIGSAASFEDALNFEDQLFNDLLNNTVVAANPGFDMQRLSKRWAIDGGEEVWHHRLWDIEAYAAGVLGLDFVPGMKALQIILNRMGYVISDPDHSAAGDVDCMRQMFYILREIADRNVLPTTVSLG